MSFLKGLKKVYHSFAKNAAPDHKERGGSGAGHTTYRTIAGIIRRRKEAAERYKQILLSRGVKEWKFEGTVKTFMARDYKNAYRKYLNFLRDTNPAQYLDEILYGIVSKNTAI